MSASYGLLHVRWDDEFSCLRLTAGVYAQRCSAHWLGPDHTFTEKQVKAFRPLNSFRFLSY